ncbi:MAG: dienelactone hydrolase family protein [Bacteroidota bacterium]
MKPTQIDQYQKSSFTAPIRSGHQITHDVYEHGAGKVVVIIQELPGIGQETLHLADRFVARGYKVVLPHLFGPIGKTNTYANLARVLCMRKEFRVFTANKSSPVIDWLKALCQKLKTDNQVSGVATIGMCLTGNFAIALMADDSVLAGFASQPSLPLGKGGKLHLGETEIQAIKTRLEDLGPMHCGRFEGDHFCTAERFKLYEETFNGDGVERIKLHTLPGDKHAILTLDFVDEEGHPTKQAFETVVAYFDQSLASQ